jgi:DEAD/DEAH box helicase
LRATVGTSRCPDRPSGVDHPHVDKPYVEHPMRNSTPGRRPFNLGDFMAASRPSTTTTTVPARPPISFVQLGLPPKLVAALAGAGITEPFPIQAATLPDTLAGRDVLGRGRTGSGKTYAFVLPVPSSTRPTTWPTSASCRPCGG